MTYVDAYLIPVPRSKLEKYAVFSKQVALVYREHGALRIVDCVLDDAVANGAEFHAAEAREALDEAAHPLKDFPDAAGAREGETVILSWTEWPSKEARDKGLAAATADPRLQPEEGEEQLFEGRRLVAGGFKLLVET
ncbi:MAG: DUF1428 domain-containing protein [Burkholderiaceae bacterium]